MKNEMIEIFGERVYLRNMLEEDASDIVKWRNDPAIRKWMFNQELLTIEKHLKWFHDKNTLSRIDYVICDNITDKAIGTVNFTNIEKNKAEAGKMLGNKDYWGKGYAKESFLLWLKYGFETLGFNSIYVRTMIDNIPNIKLNEKLGFETKEQARISYSNKTYDILLMELKVEYLKY